MPKPPSLANCHAIGLDSLVIRDRISPQSGMIRVFVARPEHELWTNRADANLKFSIGLHSHHCDITMVPLFGNVFNVLQKYVPQKMHRSYLASFSYESAISADGSETTGTGRFRNLHDVLWPFYLAEHPLDTATVLPGASVHTVYVPRGEAAAWMILEGAENPDYTPVTYSNHDLTQANFSGLYQPMDPARWEDTHCLLRCAGVRL